MKFLSIYNLYHVTKNMGLSVKNPPLPFTEVLLYKYLNLMESYVFVSKEYCFIIASLLWENRQYIQEDIRREKKDSQLTINFTSILTNILIKLGVPISAKTLQENKGDGYELLGSFVLELQRTYDLLAKHTVQFIEDQTLELNDFQKEIWEGLDSKYKAFAFSAGTSTGKSFLLTHKMISWAYEQIITNNQIFRAVIIVPSIALINQNLIDLSNLLKNIPQLNQKIKLHQHFIEIEKDQNAIFIVTQERMRETIYDLSQQDINIQNIFLSLNLLVCDEIQNIGISTSDDASDNNQYNQRADLYHSIFELITDNNSINIQKIILAGANISKNDLQQKYKKMLNEKSFTYFPKENKKYISPVTNIQLSLLSDSQQNRYYIKQEILLQENDTISLQIEVQNHKLFEPRWNNDKLKGSTLINNTYDVLNNLNKNYPNMVVISYQRTPSMINTSAKTLINKNPESKNALRSLHESLKKYLPENSKVVQASQYGVALHHGQLPKEVRIILELAIKENKIDVIICNSTITQGVNLPVKFIIIPNKGNLSHKNELLNLKGRAGRLMQDLVGYVLFLDVKTFEMNNNNNPDKVSSMLDNTIPEDMDTADEYYQKIIDQHSDSINEVLETLEGVGRNEDINPDIARTVIKIRQQLLKDNRIKDNDLYLGIDRSILQKNLEKLGEHETELGTLSSLTLKHMVIDPMDIYYLYNRSSQFLYWFDQDNHNMLTYTYYKSILDLYNIDLKYYVKEIMRVTKLNYIYGFCEKWLDNQTYLLREILTEQQQYCQQNNLNTFDELNILKAYTSYISYDFVKLVAVIEDLYRYRHTVETNWTSLLRYGTNNQKIKDLMHMGLEREISILIQRATNNIENLNESITHYYNNHADEWEKKLLEKFNYI
ncbi:MAG: DEAD/DEAH box helicase [Brevinema sp.]